jgi:hypothetical protein
MRKYVYNTRVFIKTLVFYTYLRILVYNYD